MWTLRLVQLQFITIKNGQGKYFRLFSRLSEVLEKSHTVNSWVCFLVMRLFLLRFFFYSISRESREDLLEKQLGGNRIHVKAPYERCKRKWKVTPDLDARIALWKASGRLENFFLTSHLLHSMNISRLLLLIVALLETSDILVDFKYR